MTEADYNRAMRAIRGLQFLGDHLHQDIVSNTLVLSKLEIAAADVDVVQSIRDAIVFLLAMRASNRQTLAEHKP